VTKFESVLSQALELDEEERQLLALRLEASLGEAKEPGYDAAWEAEIKRRVEELERGEVELIEWDDAMKFIFESPAEVSA
jgi:hypothetical protein